MTGWLHGAKRAADRIDLRMAGWSLDCDESSAPVWCFARQQRRECVMVWKVRS
jgi:hypothetical protein